MKVILIVGECQGTSGESIVCVLACVDVCMHACILTFVPLPLLILMLLSVTSNSSKKSGYSPVIVVHGCNASTWEPWQKDLRFKACTVELMRSCLRV